LKGIKEPLGGPERAPGKGWKGAHNRLLKGLVGGLITGS